ncbi:hypothetical protein O6R05_06935 [Peptoniphilus equinus]|uniref:Uncharacterized protein n=1 Tax=Peptoniphilus equinus TaxID=3016343 RepID=A0ABY7QSF4_9FIRM|nr:hypothetical protein [Peptoniphilus equinus]WBW49731.1 hypothetical protein O6R05_06935 [Peptoniphilus equinus]
MLVTGIFTTTIDAKNFDVPSPVIMQAQSSNLELSQDSVDFLKNSGLDMDAFEGALSKFQTDQPIAERSKNDAFNVGEQKEVYVGNLESDIQALKNAAQANGFSDEQIQLYIEGLLKNLNERIVPSTVMLRSAPDRAEKDSYGVGFEALSEKKFSQITTRVKLPSAQVNDVNEIPYVFITPVSATENFDFGLKRGASIWDAFVLLGDPAINPDKRMLEYPLKSSVADGDMLYYQIYRDSDGYMVCKILNNADFSDVKISQSVWLNNSLPDQISFNKQITMTFPPSGTVGSSIMDARFSDSYLYDNSGNYVFETRVDNSHYGIFGDLRIPGSRNYTTHQHSEATDYVNIQLR